MIFRDGLFGIFLLAFMLLSLGGVAVANEGKGLVTVIKGEADKRSEVGHWTDLKEQEKIITGDQVRTLKQSLAEIVLHKSQKIRLGPETTVDFQNVFEKGEKKVSSLDLMEGDIWAEVDKLDQDSSFEINNKLAHATVRGTIFSLHADKKNAVLNVYRGAVAVSGKQKKQPSEVQPVSTSEAAYEPREIAGPSEVDGVHEVEGPKEVSLKKWMQIVHAMQQIVVSSDGSWRVRDIGKQEIQRAKWERWGKEILAR